jgi:hypothetical protein
VNRDANGSRGRPLPVRYSELAAGVVHRPPVILDIGAEGGLLTIAGIRTADSWRFRLVRDETTLRALLNAEDREGLEFWHQDFDRFQTIRASGITVPLAARRSPRRVPR